MTSILGISLPSFGISRSDVTSPKNLALGGIAATALVGGGVIGKIKGNPLAGLGIGAAIAAVALGASLVGNASHSYGHPYDHYDPHNHDPGYRDRDHDGAREDWPSGGEHYPGGGTSFGDD